MSALGAVPETLGALASAVIIVDRKRQEAALKSVKVNVRVPVNVAVPLTGGFAPILQGLSGQEGQRRVIGGYLVLSGGAARAMQVSIVPKSPAATFPISDNAIGSWTLFNTLFIDQDDVLGVLVAAAADATVLVGWLTVEDELYL